ncbi:MAG TPA: low affinity iron permease family protein [Acidimicrobiales bacterium]|nr:low affinity iron permease family protein [Acidimicrobiales bacterium]
MESSKFEHRFSRVLQWLDDVTSRAAATAIVAIVVVIFLIALTVAGFPGNWEVAFSTGAASITLVMLFVIQHTQGRQQIALQLKLDELIRASPQADDLLVHIERADEEELLGREQEQAAHHEALREGTESEGDDKKKSTSKKE